MLGAAAVLLAAWAGLLGAAWGCRRAARPGRRWEVELRWWRIDVFVPECRCAGFVF